MTDIAIQTNVHPLEKYLREDRLPHIWCPGCGLGIIINCFIRGLLQTNIDLNDVAVVSGIGCTGRAAGYIKLDSFHTTHGRAIPFATGLKLAKSGTKVIVISGDGDLVAIGGNHFIHAARRNLDITVICANNFIYGMTGGQLAPTTPQNARSTTTPLGNRERPFNIPDLAATCGSVYVARWTSAQVNQMEKAMSEAIMKKGFSLVEIINPCPTYYGRLNAQSSGLEIMRFYRDNVIVRHGIDTKKVDITAGNPIIIGKFIDIERPYFPGEIS